MKKSASIIIFFALAVSLIAQEDKTEFYQDRLHHFQKMESHGKILVVTGAVMEVGGISLFAVGLSELDFRLGGSSNESSDKLVYGIVLIGGGIVAIAGGIIFWNFGKRRVQRYENLLKKEEKELSLKFTNKGLSLQLSF